MVALASVKKGGVYIFYTLIRNIQWYAWLNQKLIHAPPYRMRAWYNIPVFDSLHMTDH